MGELIPHRTDPYRIRGFKFLLLNHIYTLVGSMRLFVGQCPNLRGEGVVYPWSTVITMVAGGVNWNCDICSYLFPSCTGREKLATVAARAGCVFSRYSPRRIGRELVLQISHNR